MQSIILHKDKKALRGDRRDFVCLRFDWFELDVFNIFQALLVFADERDVVLGDLGLADKFDL